MVTGSAPSADVVAEICALDAPLWRKLETYVAHQRSTGSPFVAAAQALVERLRSGEVGESAPAPDAAMPPFLLPDAQGRLVGLDDIVANGPAVISFNRGHWCPFCRIELTALAQAHWEFAEMGVPVVAILPDRQQFAGRLPAIVRDRLTLLSDMDCAYALSLGLVMWLGDDLRGLMQGAGLDLAEVNGNPSWAVPVPATFVVDGQGRVVARRVEADFRQRMEIDDIRAALRRARGLDA